MGARGRVGLWLKCKSLEVSEDVNTGGAVPPVGPLIRLLSVIVLTDQARQAICDVVERWKYRIWRNGDKFHVAR